MTFIRIFLLSACMLVPFIARAQTLPSLPPAVTDVVYKGVVGKALDAVPMDADKRVVLQRTNAVVSNTLTGRSLSVWAGLSNPILLVAGVVWGIYAAVNIRAPEVKDAPNTIRIDPIDNEPLQETFLVDAPTLEDTDVAP
jgi:hypothetical protein